ncbi:hypothetical protein F5Y15DRAFT_427701 [Xylariaceae sp. FL0016]|nr:hypothetical protein F5Y15DRAFT_427701 [Xylariaceae sp. FL0016]
MSAHNLPTTLACQLTLIITTSPTPSAPETELISSILAAFNRHCTGLLSCRVIVVFDTYDRVGSEARLKRGQVTAEFARNYDLYKQNVKELILREFCSDMAGQKMEQENGSAEFGSPCMGSNCVPLLISRTTNRTVTFIEPERRIGFGLAVRAALRLTETPYVWVQQHDWSLISDIPLRPLLEVMEASEHDENVPVKYVCLPSVRMLAYAVSAHVVQFPVLNKLTAELKRDFSSKTEPEAQMTLTPLFFWHDKPHIASTSHYLARVFPTRLAMSRGDFIEDHIGQRARQQMKEGAWAKWACWLYYPEDGRQLCLRHLNGRTWRGTEREALKKALYLESQAKET